MTKAGGADRYRGEMDRCLRSMLDALAPGGKVVMLIGDGTAGGKPLRARSVVDRITGRLGARVSASASQRRRDWRGGPPRYEHLLLIERR